MPVKKGSTKRGSNGAGPESGIIIYLYQDFGKPDLNCPIVIRETNLSFTAEALCVKVCRELSIKLFSHFALVRPDHRCWLPPNHVIESSPENVKEFWFRMRFIPAPENVKKLPSMDSAAFKYFYLQCRDDYLNDRVKYKTKSQDKILGLAVTDMVRYGAEYELRLEELEKQTSVDFIPRSYKNVNFSNMLDKFRLQKNFKTFLKREFLSHDSADTRKLTFLNGIFNDALDYVSEEVRYLPKRLVVKVRPFHGESPGISYEEKHVETYFSAIEDLISISLMHEEMCVTIDRKDGPPLTVPFDTKDEALSFIALLDGYYRLSEDYHRHLCNDVESPLVSSLRTLRSHGPVDKLWALRRLEERRKKNSDYNYLVKMKSDDLGKYVLIYLDEKEPKTMIINQLANNQFQIAQQGEPVFRSMPELLDYYRSGKSSVLNLKMCVPPTHPLDPRLYLCRTEKRNTLVDSLSTKQHQSQVGLVSGVQLSGKIFGTGRFTQVQLGSWYKPDIDEAVAVAVKQLVSEEDGNLKAFQTSIHKAMFWSSPTIVTVQALCLSPFQVLMDVAHLGCLTDYLKNPQRNVSLGTRHLLMAAEKLAQALLYLQDGKFESIDSRIHGNIRGRNVMVFNHNDSDLYVKLGDPGLIHKYNSGSTIDLERVPWIAPELFDNLEGMTLYSDRYAFGMLLWELFSMGRRPFGDLMAEKVINEVKAGGKLESPAKCPPVIYKIMTSCWDMQPDRRILPSDVVRDVRDTLLNPRDHNDRVYSEIDPKVEMNGGKGAVAASACNVVDNPLAFLPGDGFPADDNLDELADNFLNNCTRYGFIPQTSLPDPPSPKSESPRLTPSSGESNGNGLSESVATTTTVLSTKTLPPPSGPERADIQNRPLPEAPEDKYIISGKRLRINQERKLGKGHYGQVLKGRLFTSENSQEYRCVAVKRLFPRDSRFDIVRELETEFRTMVQLDHPNIVQVIGQCPPNYELSQNPMMLVLEFVEKGCLRDFLKQKTSADFVQEATPYPMDKLVEHCLEIAKGMEYLSSKHIIHGDLAARNVLVTSEEHMKISDFGLSRVLDPDYKDYYRARKDKEIPASWCAPEVLCDRKYTVKGDVWSYAVTLWEIFNFGRKNPKLCENMDLVNKLHEGHRLERPTHCRKQWYTELIMKCWEWKMENRLLFTDIVAYWENISSQKPQ